MKRYDASGTSVLDLPWWRDESVKRQWDRNVLFLYAKHFLLMLVSVILRFFSTVTSEELRLCNLSSSSTCYSHITRAAGQEAWVFPKALKQVSSGPARGFFSFLGGRGGRLWESEGFVDLERTLPGDCKRLYFPGGFQTEPPPHCCVPS